jgi:hypothetical protein
MIRRLFNNRAFIIGLAVCSGLLMVRSIAAPFLDEPDFSDVQSPEFDPQREARVELEIVAADSTSIDPEAEEEGALWRAEQSVLSGQLTWNSRPRRDPFRGVTTDVVQVQEVAPGSISDGIPRLDALVAGPESVFAVLNDQIVREGDLLEGYEVTRISPDGVRIASRWESHWLPVSGMVIEVIEVETKAPAVGLGEPVDELTGMAGPEPGG